MKIIIIVHSLTKMPIDLRNFSLIGTGWSHTVGLVHF